MRIVQVHNRYRSAVPSGENRVVDQEAEALVSLGHEVVRFERHSDDIEHWSRVKKASLPARILWNREAHRELALTLRQCRPDVVHVHNTFPLLGAAILHACRDAAVPVVATLHNRRLVCARGDFFRDGSVCHDCASGSVVPALVHGCYRGSRVATAPVVLAASVHRQAWRTLVSAYLFVSMSLRDQLAELNLAQDRVFVRHHLIPRRTAAAAVREPSVFYAGRLDEAKGARLLMTSWERYRSTSGDRGLRLVIAGSGPLEPEVRAWASGLPSVEFLGQVSGPRCAELMARARAVIVPSVCEETFGLAAVEAMALGVAPVAAGHGALPELVTAGVDGMLFRPGDPGALAHALADIEAHPARYQSYGDRARRTYEERFDPERNLDQLLDIYRFAIAHPVFRADGQASPARVGALTGD
jgi:glycosyltransferase involved in cell wall biosynthesis